MIKLPFEFDLKKNQSQVVMAIILGCVLILAGYLIFILKPQITKLSATLAKTKSLRGELKAAEADIAKIDKFKHDIEIYKEKVDLYEKRLPIEQEIPSLLENLSRMAKKSNITIVGITPVAVGSLKGQRPSTMTDQIYQEVPILISAKSGYHELGAFLSDMENADRFMKVVDIEIRSNKASPKKHDVELLIYTYILFKE